MESKKQYSYSKRRDSKPSRSKNSLLVLFLIACGIGIALSINESAAIEGKTLEADEEKYLVAGEKVKSEEIIDLPKGTMLESANIDGGQCTYTFRERYKLEPPKTHYVKSSLNNKTFVIREH